MRAKSSKKKRSPQTRGYSTSLHLRVRERLERTQKQYDNVKAEKDNFELNSLKLSRDLEKVQFELKEMKEMRGMEDKRGAMADKLTRELDDLHDRSVGAEAGLVSPM